VLTVTRHLGTQIEARVERAEQQGSHVPGHADGTARVDGFSRKYDSPALAGRNRLTARLLCTEPAGSRCSSVVTISSIPQAGSELSARSGLGC
jgi:hypothetical protein